MQELLQEACIFMRRKAFSGMNCLVAGADGATGTSGTTGTLRASGSGGATGDFGPVENSPTKL